MRVLIEEIADHLRDYATAKQKNPGLDRPYLHDFIDVFTEFGNLGDKTGFGGITTEKSGYRMVDGSFVEVKLIPRKAHSNGKWNYNTNTIDNQIGTFGFKEYKIGRNIYSESYYNNRS